MIWWKIYGTIDTIGSESLTRTSAQPENHHDGTCQCPYREHPCLQPRGTFPDDEQEKPESAEIKRSTGIGVIIKPIKIKNTGKSFKSFIFTQYIVFQCVVVKDFERDPS